MAQHELRGFEAGLAPDVGCRAVPQLVRLPTVDASPIAELPFLLGGEPRVPLLVGFAVAAAEGFWRRERLGAGPLDGAAVARFHVSRAGCKHPPAHAQFVGFLPSDERHDILGAYLRRLTDPDPAVHLPAARAWSVYEGTCSTLLPSPETVTSFSQDRTALGLARIEAFYFAHGLFLPRDGLLAHMRQIAHIPAEIVQGRYDMICPATTAFELAASWRNARLTVVPDAGHSALEPGIRRALVAAVERFRMGR